jgi:hypothetical protein
VPTDLCLTGDLQTEQTVTRFDCAAAAGEEAAGLHLPAAVVVRQLRKLLGLRQPGT